MRRVPWITILLVATSLAACGDDDGMVPDAGTRDGSAGADAGTDAGTDAGNERDSGLPDMACEPSGIFCTEAEVCRKSTGFCLGPGRCLARPEACPADAGPPVCGCDGVTYGSECDAHRAGESLQALGACDGGA